MIDPLIQRDDDAAANAGGRETQSLPKQSLVNYVFCGLLLYPFLQGAGQGVAAFLYHRFAPRFTLSDETRRGVMLGGGVVLVLASLVLFLTPVQSSHRHVRDR